MEGFRVGETVCGGFQGGGGETVCGGFQGGGGGRDSEWRGRQCVWRVSTVD